MRAASRPDLDERLAALGLTETAVELVERGYCVVEDAEPLEFEMEGWGNAFATMGDLPEYDGAILQAHLFRGGKRTGEIAAIDIWPILGLDLGVLGLRGRLFNLEAGAGTLFYRPLPHTELIADADADVDTD